VSASTHGLGCGRLEDCAAYVLRALGEQELHDYHAHLPECPVCRAEVAQLQPVSDLLPLGVPPASAPEGLRARIVGTAHAEAELRGGARAKAQLRGAAGRESNGTASGRAGWPAILRRVTLARRLAPALVGVLALAVGLAIGGLLFSSGSSGRTEVIRAVVVSPDHRATAELRKVGSRLDLVVVGMPAPPPGRIYEVWLEHGAAAPQPTDALFSVTRTGNGSVGVPGDLDGVSKVLVTDEPLGGSLKPTRTPVIVGSI
jgi:Anti-sigma-K factor rskA